MTQNQPFEVPQQLRQLVLSRYRVDVARLCNEFCAQAAAVAACQVLIASPRNWRSVLREIRCRWTLKVL